MDFNKQDLLTLKDSLQELYIKQILEKKNIEGYVETIPFMIFSDNEQQDKTKKQQELEKSRAKLDNIKDNLLTTETLKKKIETALNNADN